MSLYSWNMRSMCVEMSDLICAIFSDREDFSEIAFVEKHIHFCLPSWVKSNSCQVWMSNCISLYLFYYKHLALLFFSILEHVNSKIHIKHLLVWFVSYSSWVSFKIFESMPTYHLHKSRFFEDKPRERLTECYHWGDLNWQSGEHANTDSNSAEI